MERLGDDDVGGLVPPQGVVVVVVMVVLTAPPGHAPLPLAAGHHRSGGRVGVGVWLVGVVGRMGGGGPRGRRRMGMRLVRILRNWRDGTADGRGPHSGTGMRLSLNDISRPTTHT